jgi:guanylate kinase
MADLKRVFVISAPSGAGKTTLRRMLVENHDEVEVSVSLTSRKMREGEVNGIDYTFVTKAEFEANIAKGEMLEWANVHGNLYGTSKTQLKNIEARGHYAILTIDVQGWLIAAKKLKKATAIFVLPPSLELLWERLEKRGTDSEEIRWRRLVNAKEEIEKADNYDYFIVNDNLQRAYQDLERIVINGEPGKIGTQMGKQLCEKLLAEFDQSSWFKSLREKFN